MPKYTWTQKRQWEKIESFQEENWKKKDSRIAHSMHTYISGSSSNSKTNYSYVDDKKYLKVAAAAAFFIPVLKGTK